MSKKSFISTIASLVICLMSNTASWAQTRPDATYMYAQRDTCDLYLDIYEPAESMKFTADGKEKPSIIFMFGGGFIVGNRDHESYDKWFTHMKNDGYRIISIDYRLGLKGSKKVGVAQVNVLDKAIHMAVEDLFSATNFLIENSGETGHRPEQSRNKRIICRSYKRNAG